MGSSLESVMYSILTKKMNFVVHDFNLVKSVRRLKRCDPRQEWILYQAIALLYLEGVCLAGMDYLKTYPGGVKRRWKDVAACARDWGVSERVLQQKVKDLVRTEMAMLNEAYASERSRSKALCSFAIIITQEPPLLLCLLTALEDRVDPKPLTWKRVFETRAELKGADQMRTPKQETKFRRVFRQFLHRRGVAGLPGIAFRQRTVKRTFSNKGKCAVKKVLVANKRVAKLYVHSSSSSSSSAGRVEKTVCVNPDTVTWTKPPSLAPEVYVPVLVEEDRWRPSAVGDFTSCELFCGTAGISTRLFEKHGFSTTLVDVQDCRNGTNRNTFLKGFLQKDVLTLNKRRLKQIFSSRVIWVAPPCFTYSIQSQATHQRNETNGYYGVTAEAHHINDLVSFLLGWFKRLHLKEADPKKKQLVVFEAPEGVFEHTPFASELEALGLKPVRVSQCAWGCRLRKNTLLYTNSKELQGLKRAHYYCGRGNQGCTLKEGQGNHEDVGRGRALQLYGTHYHPAAARAWADKLAKEVRGILKRRRQEENKNKRRRIN